MDETNGASKPARTENTIGMKNERVEKETDTHKYTNIQMTCLAETCSWCDCISLTRFNVFGQRTSASAKVSVEQQREHSLCSFFSVDLFYFHFILAHIHSFFVRPSTSTHFNIVNTNVFVVVGVCLKGKQKKAAAHNHTIKCLFV